MEHNVGQTSFAERSPHLPAFQRSMAIHGNLAHWRQNCPPVPTSFIQERRANYCEYWRKRSIPKFLNIFSGRSIKSWNEKPSETKNQPDDNARPRWQTSEGQIQRIAPLATRSSQTSCSTVRRLFRNDNERRTEKSAFLVLGEIRAHDFSSTNSEKGILIPCPRKWTHRREK